MKSVRAIAIAGAILVASVGSASAQSAGSGQMTGRHTMEGKVTSVSAKTGWVHIKTDEGTIIVHFPSSVLADVKKGDTIAMDLAMKDNGPAMKKGVSGR